MKSNELYGAIGVVAIAAFASWAFSCEVLFIMGIIITISLASVVGLVLGSITLTERVLLARARARHEWGVSARSSAGAGASTRTSTTR